ncbi:MAG: ABC transporter permease subunit [Ruthenibacterium sp.]
MKFLKELKKNKQLYLLSIPGIICMIVFSYIPMSGHILAFKAYDLKKGFFGGEWVGLKNFEFFFGSNDWKVITFNTVFLNILFIVVTQVAAIVLAILINEVTSRFFKRFFQSVVFLPYFVSWLVVSLMLVALLNSSDGMLNSFLASMGKDKIGFYMNPDYWPTILTIAYVWKFAGYYSIIYLATIIGIPKDYFESASIDGASKLQQILKITLPLMVKTIIIMLLLSIGRIFYGDFGMIYGIIGENGILFPTTDVIDTYVYRALKTLGNFGMASAVGLYQSFMGLITICVFNAIVKKIDPDAQLF